MVAGRRPRRVRSAMYSATVSDSAGSRARPIRAAKAQKSRQSLAYARSLGGAAGFGGRPGVGTQLLDRRRGVGGEEGEGRFFFV